MPSEIPVTIGKIQEGIINCIEAQLNYFLEELCFLCLVRQELRAVIRPDGQGHCNPNENF